MEAGHSSARSGPRLTTSRPVSSNLSTNKPQQPTLRFSTAETSRIFAPNASIVLVGIRGCGKTSLGYIAARALGRRFVESDDEFERKTGCSRAQFLKKNGQNEEEYRKQELQVMESMLTNNERDAVITCGAGSLEFVGQALLKKYTLTHPVIHIVREADRIGEWLRIPKESYLMRRLEESDRNHRICSNFEFYNLFDGGSIPELMSGTVSPIPGGQRFPRYTGGLQRTQEDFIRFVNLIMGFMDDSLQRLSSKITAAAASPADRIFTYALTVGFSQLIKGNINVLDLECGADAIELEVRATDVYGYSLSVDTPWITKLAEQFAILRRKVAAPIIFHVNRNSSVVAKDLIEDEMYLELLYLGLRMGAEYLTVDLDLQDRIIEQVQRSKGQTALIGNFMDISPTQLGWDDPGKVRRHTKAVSLRFDIIRMSQFASSDEDNIAIRRFIQQATFKKNSLPLIAYNVGRLGRVSMCYNTILTAVTHPLLRGESLKKQQALLTMQEASRMTYDLGLLDPLEYWLFGANITYSLSPALHNSSYQVTGLPHTYQIRQTPTFEGVQDILKDPSFGGCSISLPYKIAVLQRVDTLSEEAQAIGAVNTIIPIRESKKDGSRVLNSRAGKTVGFHGENTDWVAIMVCIRRNLSPANLIRSWTSGLVIGAGGMARAAIYALIRLDVPNIFIYNRTVANAEKVAAHFSEITKNMQKGSRSPNAKVRVRHQFIIIKSLKDAWPNKEFQLPTIIVSCITAHQIGDVPAPNLNIPDHWLQRANGGVIVEVAYKPAVTPLMEQVRRLREEGRPWVPISGLEVLPEQGMAQWQLMTGRTAPRHMIRELKFSEIIEAQENRTSKVSSGNTGTESGPSYTITEDILHRSEAVRAIPLPQL